MTTTVRPNDGAGAITFGMTREQVRRLLSDEAARVKATDSVVPADYFAQRGMIVHYTDDGLVEAVELGSLAEPEVFGEPIVGRPFDEVLTWLRSHDPRVEVDESGFTSFRFGIGAYAPHASKSASDPIEGVIVFRPGYYG
jgi:hypothetical protein